jgi:hypothetical protein
MLLFALEIGFFVRFILDFVFLIIILDFLLKKNDSPLLLFVPYLLKKL